MERYLQKHGGVPLDHPRRCRAHRQDGKPCRRYAIRGGHVCRVHGGAAPQVMAKAREALALASYTMAKNLLGMATEAESEAVKLAATNSALDRAGISAKQAIEIGVDPKPWEELLANLSGVEHITREESRARRGLPPDPPDSPRPLRPYEVVDAEVVDPADPPCNAADGRMAPTPPDYPPEPSHTPTPPPGRGLVPLEDAVGGSRVRPLKRLPRRT